MADKATVGGDGVTAERFRFEVEDSKRGGVILYIDVHDPDPALDEIAAHAVAELEAVGVRDARMLLASELAFRLADERAYEREAQRRGVLPL